MTNSSPRSPEFLLLLLVANLQNRTRLMEHSVKLVESGKYSFESEDFQNIMRGHLKLSQDTMNLIQDLMTKSRNGSSA